MLERVRRNHAIEHATVAVLFARRGRMLSTVGISDPGGFHIWGPYDPDEVASAADEAIQRLAAGEHWLAISPQCGTNIAVTGVLAALATLAATARRRRRDSIGDAFSAATLAATAALPIGRWVQGRFTVDPHVEGYSVRRVRSQRMGGNTYVRVSLTPPR